MQTDGEGICTWRALPNLSRMATFRTLAFARPATLREVRRDLLSKLLTPHAAFLKARKIELSSLGDANNHAALVSLSDVLMQPGADTPPALVDALFCISEIASEETFELLVETCDRLSLVIGTEPTPMDLAVALWTHAPDEARKIHSELLPQRIRSYEYFSAADEGPKRPFMGAPESALRIIEKDLDSWFMHKKMGCGCRVHCYQRGTETWFLIRHGDSYRREATVADNGASGAVCFRPERYDIVVYDQAADELRINARSMTVRDRYRSTFGLYLFGHEGHFPCTGKYSLEPLRRFGRESLTCTDVPGLVGVRLVELIYEMDGPPHEKLVRKAADVFAVLEYNKSPIPPQARLLRAHFRVRFRDNPKERAIAIKPNNGTQYQRDGDSELIEEWLMRRGFVENRRMLGNAQRECILEVS